MAEYGHITYVAKMLTAAPMDRKGSLIPPSKGELELITKQTSQTQSSNS